MDPDDKGFNKRLGLTRERAPAVFAWALTITAMVFLAGCRDLVDLSQPPLSSDQAVVLLNGEPISLEEFDTEFRLMAIYYSAVSETKMRVIKRALFDQVLDRRLLVQRALRRGYQVTRSELEKVLADALVDAPQGFLEILKEQGVSVEAWKRKVAQEYLVRKLAEREVYRKVKVGKTEVEAYYWSHLGIYWKTEAIRARHLVVQTKRELMKAQARLTAGESFDKIALEFSVAPHKEKGGDWGWLPMEGISPRYAKALLALTPGEVSKPLQDGFGWHLFQLIEIRPTLMREFHEVEVEIRDMLVRREQDRRFVLWLDGLKKTATVEVNQDLAPVVGIVWEDSSDHVKPHVRKKKGAPKKAVR